jgi:hypothetical protein
MRNITLRSATTDDATFALHVTEVCMRAYAEQTWGTWNGLPDFDPTTDIIVERDGRGSANTEDNVQNLSHFQD